MLKKFCRRILKDEIINLVDAKNRTEQMNRLLKETLEEVKAENKPVKNFNIIPDKLTSDEQFTIGRFVDSPILELISKWMKAQADLNNDLLVHGASEAPEKLALWRTAILVYEDWIGLLAHCKSTAVRAEKREESQKQKEGLHEGKIEVKA